MARGAHTDDHHNGPRTARARARRDLIEEIKRVARAHLAEHGAAGLSLRSVTRDVGMVSSAVYRYFPSRDDLLTALIVDAYAALGESTRTAEEQVRRKDLLGRWMAVACAVRSWALASPQEYGLIFGTPVPGYRAPDATIDPAAVVPALLLVILADAAAAGRRATWADRPVAASVRADLRAFRSAVASSPAPLPALAPAPLPLASLDDATVTQGVLAWTVLIGAISFELFGHLRNVIVDHERHFQQQMRNVGLDLGFGAVARAPQRPAGAQS